MTEWVGRFRADADTSHRAPSTVKEVEAEGDHRNHVEERYPPDPKAEGDVGVNITRSEDSSGADGSRREMKDVEDDEEQQQRAAPPHRARRNRRRLGIALHVSNRTRGATLSRQLNGGSDVEDHGNDQQRAQGPEQLSAAFEKVRE